MAQTKRKRRTKHRGNAAGMVEARGRTGSKPSPEAVKRAKAPVDRRAKPPTWSGAAQRAGIAAVLFGVLIVVLFKRPVVAGITLAAVMMLVYVPMTYYTDRLLHTRYMRKHGQGGAR
jgi:hypothetical protein